MIVQTGGAADANVSPNEMEYWAHRGPKMAAFLLVIPGATVLGFGLGLALHSIIPWTVMGLGAGMLLWGLVVALTR